MLMHEKHDTGSVNRLASLISCYRKYQIELRHSCVVLALFYLFRPIAKHYKTDAHSVDDADAPTQKHQSRWIDACTCETFTPFFSPKWAEDAWLRIRSMLAQIESDRKSGLKLRSSNTAPSLRYPSVCLKSKKWNLMYTYMASERM